MGTSRRGATKIQGFVLTCWSQALVMQPPLATTRERMATLLSTRHRTVAVFDPSDSGRLVLAIPWHHNPKSGD